MPANLSPPRMHLPALALSAALCLSGCATVNETTNGWLASEAQAFAVVGTKVLRGQARFTGEREATVLLQDSETPKLTCFGPLHFTSTAAGVIDLSCGSAGPVTVAFRALSPLSGTGLGVMGSGEFAMTYGVPAEKAAGYLGLSAAHLLGPQTKLSFPLGER
ncbi:MAG: hypothetical protein WCH44_18015 [Betaproteobacteria bacterium]